MEDEDLESGLDAVNDTEATDETEDAATEDVEMSPLEIARRYRKADVRKTAAADELKKQLEAARNVLLQQPTQMSRSDKLLGIASTLLAPGPVGRAGTIAESLGGLGKYLSGVSAEEREAKQAQAKALAQFDTQRAQQEVTAATEEQKTLASLLGKYAAKKPAETETTATRSIREKAALLGMTPAEYMRQERSDKLLLAGRLAGSQGQKYVNDFSILEDKNSSVAEKNAALSRLPKDVRDAWNAKRKDEISYTSRLSDLNRVVVPDIKFAIDLVKKNPKLAAGNIGAWLKGKPIIGQSATDLDNVLKSVRSKVGFGKLEELKKMSAYGASGLGAVSNIELDLLQSVEGALQQNTGADVLIRTLERLQDFYENQAPPMVKAFGFSESNIIPAAPGAAPGETTPALGISPDAIRAERERRSKSGGK